MCHYLIFAEFCSVWRYGRFPRRFKTPYRAILIQRGSHWLFKRQIKKHVFPFVGNVCPVIAETHLHHFSGCTSHMLTFMFTLGSVGIWKSSKTCDLGKIRTPRHNRGSPHQHSVLQAPCVLIDSRKNWLLLDLLLQISICYFYLLLVVLAIWTLSSHSCLQMPLSACHTFFPLESLKLNLFPLLVWLGTALKKGTKKETLTKQRGQLKCARNPFLGSHRGATHFTTTWLPLTAIDLIAIDCYW